MIDCFVNRIFLYDDHLVLTFNYKDGTKTISLAEVESSDLNIDAVPKPPLFRKKQRGFVILLPTINRYCGGRRLFGVYG
ncbi:MAG: hypothetical protein ACLRO1_11875 [Agathobaculum sp.]